MKLKVDKRILVAAIFLWLLCNCYRAGAHDYRLPDTGQDECYDDFDPVEVPCVGTLFYGQDAHYPQGPKPAFRDNGNGTVSDLNTALIWQQIDDGTERTWQGAIDCCEDLELAGYNDWRLPSRRELILLLNFGYFRPTIDSALFPDCRSDWYWSRTPVTGKPSYSFRIDFKDGGGLGLAETEGYKTTAHYVRCVRGAAIPTGNYVDNGDGTITDLTTDLMWQKEIPQILESWADHLSYCQQLNLAGYTDWRLPNIRELESLVVDTLYDPAIDPIFSSYSSEFTSCTSLAYYPHDVFVVSFQNGSVHHRQKQNIRSARCVRLGPPSDYWERQVSPTSNGLSAVHFIDRNRGWAVGAAGTVLRTDDGGQAWEVLSFARTFPLEAVYFVDPDCGWMLENVYTFDGKGFIYHSQNGGVTWDPQDSGTNTYLHAVCFVNPKVGWVVGSAGTILATADGGHTWNPQVSGTAKGLRATFFIDATTGWATGDDGTIVKTTDGGANWMAQVSGTASRLNCIQFLDPQTGWALGTDGTILGTSDGGTNWTGQFSGGAPFLASLHFLDRNTGWTLGYNGTALLTTNGGETWQQIYSGTTNTIYDLHFVDRRTGWAIGSDGTILKSKTSTLLSAGTPWVPFLLLDD